MKKLIPNLLTLANLFCGCLAIIVLFSPNDINYLGLSTLQAIAALQALSLLFDLFDGMLARLLDAKSKIGLELDSLADVVSFGVVPGFLVFSMLSEPHFNSTNAYGFSNWAYVGLLVPLFSAYRLAKFNVNDAATPYFKGLPTPSNALFILGLYALFVENSSSLNSSQFYMLIALILASCFLLVSNLPLFSFKAKFDSFKSFLPQLILIIGAIVLFSLYGLGGFAFVIPFYILLSILFKNNFVHA